MGDIDIAAGDAGERHDLGTGGTSENIKEWPGDNRRTRRAGRAGREVLRVPAEEEIVGLNPLGLAVVEPSADGETAAMVRRMFDGAATEVHRRTRVAEDADRFRMAQLD